MAKNLDIENLITFYLEHARLGLVLGQNPRDESVHIIKVSQGLNTNTKLPNRGATVSIRQDSELERFTMVFFSNNPLESFDTKSATMPLISKPKIDFCLDPQQTQNLLSEEAVADISEYLGPTYHLKEHLLEIAIREVSTDTPPKGLSRKDLDNGRERK